LTGFAYWVVGYALPILGQMPLGLFPRRLLVVGVGVGLVEIIVASLVGAWQRYLRVKNGLRSLGLGEECPRPLRADDLEARHDVDEARSQSVFRFVKRSDSYDGEADDGQYAVYKPRPRRKLINRPNQNYSAACPREIKGERTVWHKHDCQKETQQHANKKLSLAKTLGVLELYFFNNVTVLCTSCKF
jgi:hypothetical protein